MKQKMFFSIKPNKIDHLFSAFSFMNQEPLNNKRSGTKLQQNFELKKLGQDITAEVCNNWIIFKNDYFKTKLSL